MYEAAIISRNHAALVRLVAGLFAALGLTASGSVSTVRRCVYWAVSRVLCSAEPAARRLILVLAQGLRVVQRSSSSAPTGVILRGETARVPTFSLIDPRKRFAFAGPRYADAKPCPALRSFDDPATWPVDVVEEPAPTPDDPVDAARLCLRLLALDAALSDLPRQARRMARLKARLEARYKSGDPLPKTPMRLGRPPGHRAKRRHEVDEILAECHILALRTLAPPNTS